MVLSCDYDFPFTIQALLQLAHFQIGRGLRWPDGVVDVSKQLSSAILQLCIHRLLVGIDHSLALLRAEAIIHLDRFHELNIVPLFF